MLGTRYETDLTKLRRLHHVQKHTLLVIKNVGQWMGNSHANRPASYTSFAGLCCPFSTFQHGFRLLTPGFRFVSRLRFAFFSIVRTLFGACFVTLTTLGPERGKLLHLPCLRFVVRIFLCHRRRILPPVPPVNLIRTLVDASSTEPSTLILSLRDLGAWLVLTITQHPIPATPATPRLRSRAHSRA
jgi:hypothetical protein